MSKSSKRSGKVPNVPDTPGTMPENIRLKPESAHHVANQNQFHNVKMEAEGPNTRRK